MVFDVSSCSLKQGLLSSAGCAPRTRTLTKILFSYSRGSIDKAACRMSSQPQRIAAHANVSEPGGYSAGFQQGWIHRLQTLNMSSGRGARLHTPAAFAARKQASEVQVSSSGVVFKAISCFIRMFFMRPMLQACPS